MIAYQEALSRAVLRGQRQHQAGAAPWISGFYGSGRLARQAAAAIKKSPRTKGGGRKTVSVPAVMSAGTVLASMEAV